MCLCDSPIQGTTSHFVKKGTNPWCVWCSDLTMICYTRVKNRVNIESGHHTTTTTDQETASSGGDCYGLTSDVHAGHQQLF